METSSGDYSSKFVEMERFYSQEDLSSGNLELFGSNVTNIENDQSEETSGIFVEKESLTEVNADDNGEPENVETLSSYENLDAILNEKRFPSENPSDFESSSSSCLESIEYYEFEEASAESKESQSDTNADDSSGIDAYDAKSTEQIETEIVETLEKNTGENDASKDKTLNGRSQLVNEQSAYPQGGMLDDSQASSSLNSSNMEENQFEETNKEEIHETYEHFDVIGTEEEIESEDSSGFESSDSSIFFVNGIEYRQFHESSSDSSSESNIKPDYNSAMQIYDSKKEEINQNVNLNSGTEAHTYEMKVFDEFLMPDLIKGESPEKNNIYAEEINGSDEHGGINEVESDSSEDSFGMLEYESEGSEETLVIHESECDSSSTSSDNTITNIYPGHQDDALDVVDILNPESDNITQGFFRVSKLIKYMERQCKTVSSNTMVIVEGQEIPFHKEVSCAPSQEFFGEMANKQMVYQHGHS